MSFWPSKITNIFENLSQEFPKKPYTKIDLIGKLHIIHALDNGQPKADIARDYGVHPQTITYIYKQKEALIRKYSQKYNFLNEVRCMNLNQTLLEWITGELRKGKIIKEKELCDKAEELINEISEDFNCVDDWLLDFRRRNNIMKFTSKISCSTLAKEEWNNFVTDTDVNNLYIGGTFGLYHSLDFDNYANKQQTNKYVCLLFIVNCSASDKKELVIVGDEVKEECNNVKSFPVQYFHCYNPCINYQVIENYLKKWDSELKEQNRKVTLVMDIPENFIEKLNCKNIQMKRFINMEYVTKNIGMIVTCFKFHYRRIQMTKKILFNKDSSVHTLIDYIHIMSAAWHSVASEYVQRLLFPLENGSLYIITDDANDSNYSLLQWCKLHNLPCDLEMYSDLLDSYIHCDNDLQVIKLEGNNDTILNINNSLLENTSACSSGVQAFQAMKRLVSYLQSQNAEKSIVKCAKTLEDCLEFGALQEIQQIMTTNNCTD